VSAARLPSFDLVVASVDRVDQPLRLLDSLERQTHRDFRIMLVDQNEDDRLTGALDRRPPLTIERLRAPRGLSRARNAALARIEADLVAFPDDDCVLPDDLLERVAARFAGEPTLDGLCGRAADADGTSSPSWARDAGLLTRSNLWNRAISFTIFLRADVVRDVGPFDEQLGLGAGTAWSSGEEIEYLVRALDRGARIAYDPELVVLHANPVFSAAALRAVGARDGASVGYIMRKHRYPAAALARMLVRPAGGAVLALLQRDLTRARFHASTLGGRVVGYRSAAAASR
jgi:glycosyltransferase involved in cell wall biosynthesis